jgi:hypothetical protein
MATMTNPVTSTWNMNAERLMQLAGGFMMTAALYTVTKLDIPGLLKDGARTVADLAMETGSNEDALYRVIRALVPAGVFEEVTPRTFSLSESSRALLPEIDGSIRDLVLWLGDEFHFKVWSHLPYSVATGKPAVDHVYGKPAFEAINEHLDIAYDFNTAMTCISNRLAPAVLEAYDFSGINTLMDIAGGHGAVLCEVLKQYPGMKGTLLDMPSVVEEAKCLVCSLKMDHRCIPVAGDFFESIPAGADAYYMQHIIHDWDDENALKILKNVRHAMQGYAERKLIVVDCVLPEDSKPHFGKLVDLEMLLMPGGRERTEREWHELFAKAGFQITRIVPTRAADSVIEARLRV